MEIKYEMSEPADNIFIGVLIEDGDNGLKYFQDQQ